LEQIGEETMVYDEGLADRMRDAIGEEANLTAKRMMGGVCFLINGNMVSAAHREKTGEGLFMFRVGKENEAAALSRPGARPFAPGGRRMGGIIFVPEGDCDHQSLREWVALARSFVDTLPPK